MYEKRKWTAEERRQLATGEIDGGFAGPDQSYPIAGPADVGDAWGLAGQAENPDQVRRRIIAIARRFGWIDALPETAVAWAEENGVRLKAVSLDKAANMADWLESRLHQQFTVLTDDLFGDGRLTRAERIALSGAIGDALDTLHTALQDAALRPLYERSPWDEAEPRPAMLIRAGRRLSAKQLQRLEEAQRTIADLVSWANYEGGSDDEPDDDDEDKPAKTTAGAVKALGNGRVGGYAVLWGSPAKRDLTGEFFTPETGELTAIFDAIKALPLLYHHGADNKLATAVVGPVDVMRSDTTGLWYEAQLEMAGEYRAAIEELIGQGLLGTSSGTLPAARRVDRRSGRITRWPIAELSLTPTPAEPRMMERPVAEIKSAYRALGLDEDSLERAVNNGSYAQPAEPNTGAENARLAPTAEQTVNIELERLALLKLRR